MVNDVQVFSWDVEETEGVNEAEVAFLVHGHDHEQRYILVVQGDGEKRGNDGPEDVEASGRFIFSALSVVLVPGEDEDKEFKWGKVARPGREEASKVSPPGPGEPGAVYINYF